MAESAFVELRRLLDWFQAQPRTLPLSITRAIARLGTRCVPLLLRELCGDTEVRRDAARQALVYLAQHATARGRIIRALRGLAVSAPDRAKLAALGLLSELGDHPTARFADPGAVQHASATAFAASLNTPADIAAAADMMIRQLSSGTVMSFLAVMGQTAPDRAARLVRELCCRHDVAPMWRERFAEIVPLGAIAADPVGPRLRPSRVVVLEQRADDPEKSPTNDQRMRKIVVVATRKIVGQRRWRRWAILIGDRGYIDDCIHDDASDNAESTDLVPQLVASGFRVTSTDLAEARTLVATAARRTIASKTASTARTADLPSAYYLGRDLLDLGDEHLARTPIDPTSATLGRAIDLIAADDVPTARALLARCDDTNPEVAAANAACLLAEGQWAAAAEHLQRAIDAEPAWPLHHWNMSIALYHQGDSWGCWSALQQFVSASAAPSGLCGDPDQDRRVTRAVELMSAIERRSQLGDTAKRSPHSSTASTA